MAVPKRKVSKMKRRQRQATHKRSLPAISEDKQGGGFHIPHRVNRDTGMYNGRQVLTVNADD
ncbi:MAG TPA: 50S ribosomal protein L32 [Kiritimatiellia bacterium]|nr:50S ribosomal protein L32 [Kiritimatiellia bacterium]